MGSSEIIEEVNLREMVVGEKILIFKENLSRMKWTEKRSLFYPPSFQSAL